MSAQTLLSFWGSDLSSEFYDSMLEKERGDGEHHLLTEAAVGVASPQRVFMIADSV